MVIFLNISNPVYVSSSDINDEVKIKVKMPYLFKSINTNLTVRENFTASHNLPSMIDSADTNSIMKIGDYTKNSMLLTLIIPFAFMVFMSASMDSVWSMYLMIQILSNLMNFRIKIPGNAMFVMFSG